MKFPAGFATERFRKNNRFSCHDSLAAYNCRDRILLTTPVVMWPISLAIARYIYMYNITCTRIYMYENRTHNAGPAEAEKH